MGMRVVAASLSGLTQILATRLEAREIRSDALPHRTMDTPMYCAMKGSAEARTFITGLHALKRTSRKDGRAESALWLCSDASSFQTGTAMLVAGGASINRA
jgi:enoyl-[acyl-carrier-protein] reductase (NADH)